MAYLFKRGSVCYVKFYVAGKQKEKSLGTGVYQIAKEKQRLFESARAKGEILPMPTRTPIAEIVTAYVAHIRTAKTAKSAQTDIYYLRDMFGPVCDALKVTSRKVSEKARKRPLKDDVDRRHKSPVIEADCFEAITTAQIVDFVSGQVARRGLAPKTANRYREILTRLFNWAVEQKGVRLPGDRNPASKVERYRESAPNIRFLTLKQIDEQLDALADDLKLQTMVATLIFGGLRREELLWLTHDDLDLGAGQYGMIRVRAKVIGDETWEPKTKKNRAAPVDATSADDFPTGTIGREVIQLDELDRATYQLYDKLGRLTDVWLAAVDDASVAGTDMVNPHWQYSYRSDGVQLSQRDPMGRVTNFAYDNLGNRTARSLPDGAAERWSYDEFGRTLTHVDFKGQITRYVYDDNVSLPSGENTNLGRLVEERRFDSSDSYNDGKGTPAERTHYLYDELGRQGEVTEYVGSGPTLTTDYQYDPISGQVTRVTSSATGTIHYEYDESTGRHTRTYTDGNDTSYHYDDLGRLDRVTATKLNGNTVNLVTRYTFDERGNLDTETQPNGVVTDYNYDGLDRLKQEIVTDAEGDKLFQQDYALLDDGQQDYVIEQRYSGTSGTPFSTTKIDWGYDGLNRQTSETRDEGNDGVQNGGDYTDTYGFDLNGNRVSKTHDAVSSANDETITSTYNNRDELTVEDSTINANDATYTYDANGSTTSVVQNTVTTKYVWDLRNRMTGVDSNGDGNLSDTGDIVYGYDESDQRVSRVEVGGETTKYLLDKQNPTGYAKAIEEHDGSGNITRSYVFGHDVIAQSDATNGTLYLMKDGRGTTRALINSSGNIVERYDVDAFNNKVKFTDGSGADLTTDPLTTWIAPDGYTDFATGLNRNGKRDVAGHIGRMWSQDVITPRAGDTLNSNLYVYASNNPILYSDPSGMFSLGEMLVTTGISSILGAMLAPVIKPAMTYIADAASNTLLGNSVERMLDVISAAPPAVMLGVDVAGGYGFGSASLTTGFSYEVLLSPSFTASYFAWNFLSVSAGASGGSWRGSISGKAGLVFGAENSGEYEEYFASLTVPLGSIPKKLRDKVVEWSGSLAAMAGSAAAGLPSLGPAADRWTPVLRDAAEDLGSLTGDLSWLNNAISGMKSAGSYVTIFWDPIDADPIGFDFAAGWGNTGSVSLTGSYYWEI